MMSGKQFMQTVDSYITGGVDRVKNRVRNLGEHLGGLAMGFLIAVIFISIALTVFFGTNTTGWDATTKGIWAYLPEIVLAVVIAVLAGYAWKKHGE